MFTILFAISVVFITCVDSIILNSSQNRTSNYCYTPSGNFGKCIAFKDCKSLYSIYESSISIRSHSYLEVLQLLRKSHCGYAGRNAPKVCCPEDNSLFPNLSVCGTHTEEKIFGGQNTKLDEFPWVVMLDYKYINATNGKVSHGTLISSRYVVMAEHTFKDGVDNMEYSRVVLGEYDRSKDIDCIGNECAPSAQWINTQSIILRDSDSDSDNIALVRLARNVIFSDFIKPICLPIDSSIADKDYGGTALYFTGWGLKAPGMRNDIKQTIRLPVHPKSTCESLWDVIGPGEMCVGGTEVGPCYVVGGPIMALETFNGRNNWYFIGFNHMHNSKCAKGNILLATRIAYYINWIMAAVEP